jgi:hypothetical protein
MSKKLILGLQDIHLFVSNKYEAMGRNAQIKAVSFEFNVKFLVLFDS